MTKVETIRSRMQTLRDLYQDSPQVAVTYCDLRRVYEDLLQVMEVLEAREIGFK